MVLAESLKKNNVVVQIKSKERWDLINELLEVALKNKDIRPENRDAILKALVDREKSMSTGIGNGVAIPHCTTSLVDDIVIVMGICKKGIDFEAIDNAPVQIIILLLVPKTKLTQHIKTLANIAKMMSDEELRGKLLSLKTADAIVKAMKNYQIPK